MQFMKPYNERRADYFKRKIERLGRSLKWWQCQTPYKKYGSMTIESNCSDIGEEIAYLEDAQDALKTHESNGMLWLTIYFRNGKISRFKERCVWTIVYRSPDGSAWYYLNANAFSTDKEHPDVTWNLEDIDSYEVIEDRSDDK